MPLKDGEAIGLVVGQDDSAWYQLLSAAELARLEEEVREALSHGARYLYFCRDNGAMHFLELKPIEARSLD